MKYVDAEKLKGEIIKRIYELNHDKYLSVDSKTARIVELHFIDRRIDSLKQEQSIEKDSLTWQDINELEKIINNVHYEFRSGINEESFGKLVLERFNEGKDAPSQSEVDLEEEVKKYFEGYWPGMKTPEACNHQMVLTPPAIMRMIEHFYELGLNARNEK